MRKELLMGLLVVAGMAGQAEAQQPPADDDETIDRVVVVGSRGEARLVTDSASPVDVFSGEQLAASGYNDLTKVLEFLSPSFNFPRASSGPSAQGARPATLRGLGPDQVLVLINGHRRHASALINFNNTVGRGSVPVDFNTIPVSAIERIEILRDGAAAQYGSDAIAGVINVILKADDSGEAASIQFGQADKGDGKTVILTGRKGVEIGEDGFLTISGEIHDRGDTNAAEIDPRYGRITSTLGDPAATDLQVALNAETAITDSMRAYGFLTLSHRDSEMSPLYRAPTVAPSFYPNGFLPIVNTELKDVGASIGLKGEMAGWRWDVGDTFGSSDADFTVSNSVNTSLGAGSPTRFAGGGMRYRQNIVGLTVDRSFDFLAGTHIAAGVEHRSEAYEIIRGDVASYTLSGAQGFPGFNPPSPVDVDRTAFSAFIDGEFQLTDSLEVAVAGRHEDYSDFGDKTIGKASLLWRPIDMIVMRSTLSTGIRAPSLQQQYFSTVTSQILPTGQLANVGNFAVSDPVSIALGASPLRAETSESISAGIVLTPAQGFSFSLDAYRIDIKDRISLSENLQGAQVTNILVANGITNASVARFFTNAADTTSEGWEATMHWEGQFGDDGRFSLSASYGSFDTDTNGLKVNPVLPQIALLGPASIGILTDAQPRNKALINASIGWGAFDLAADIVKFGSYRTPTASGGLALDGPTSLDLSVSWLATDNVRLQAGVLNATDEYPARLVNDTTGRPYSEADPLGFNGREYFARFAVEF